MPLTLLPSLPLGSLGALQSLKVLENSHLASAFVFQNSVLESSSPYTVSAQPLIECPCAHVAASGASEQATPGGADCTPSPLLSSVPDTVLARVGTGWIKFVLTPLAITCKKC